MLAPNNQIPTVKQAVQQLIQDLQDQGHDWRAHASVLLGAPTGKVTGRAAAGPTLARSELGELRFNRVTGDQFKRWFLQRHPTYLSNSTRKRGKSALNKLINYAVVRGWTDASTAQPLNEIHIKSSDPRRDWLHPEQIAVLDPLIHGGAFQDDEVMRWETLLATGARVQELVRLRPSCLRPADGLLVLTGKFGKTRHVPVARDFQTRWLEYAASRGLKPNDWMFPLMGYRYQSGGTNERVTLEHRMHCDQKAVRAMLERLQELARECAERGQFDTALVPTFKLNPHTLRRTYACSNLIMSAVLGPEHGLDLRSLQIALGHESLETTALYLSDVDAYLARHRRPSGIAQTLVELLTKLDDLRDASPRALAA